MHPPKTIVRPCCTNGGAGGEGGVEGAWDGSAVVVAGHVGGGGVGVRVLVPGALDEIFLAVERLVPDVAGCGELCAWR